MTGYYGLAQIAERLGVSPSTVMVWFRTRGLLMFKRHPRHHSTQAMWFASEAMILAWEASQASRQRVITLAERQERRARSAARRRDRQDRTKPDPPEPPAAA